MNVALDEVMVIELPPEFIVLVNGLITSATGHFPETMNTTPMIATTTNSVRTE